MPASGTEKLLSELIALPSVNPAFLPPGDRRTGEGRVADFLAALGASAGLDIDFQEVFPGRRNLLATLRPSSQATARVILAPHLDTVPGNESDDDLFKPRRNGGKLCGRGACDTKGSVAAMFQAVLSLARKGKRPATTEIVFAGLVDEENQQAGSRALAPVLKGELAIIGEPTELKMVTAHKGDLWLKLRTKGKCAHGARPELGDNAIRKMARAVEILEGDYCQMLKKKTHPVLGCATINVGTIHGGTQPNIVPDECEIQVDRRTLPGEKDAQVIAEIRRFVKSFGVNIEIDSAKSAPCPSMETDPDLPLVKQFGKVLGQRQPLGVDFFCDAANFALAGTPGIVFGPGNIAQAHTRDEWIDLRSLESATRFLETFLRSLP